MNDRALIEILPALIDMLTLKMAALPMKQR
jgi:hypothetical protein